MGAKTCAFFAVLALTVHSSQAALKLVYIESFPKGPTRISEHNSAASLDSQKPYYKATIKDLAGNDGYQLSLQAQRVEGGDARIVSWRGQLIGPHQRYPGNLAVATLPPELLSDRPQDRAGWLDPSPYAVLPLFATRVFGAEGLSRTGT